MPAPQLGPACKLKGCRQLRAVFNSLYTVGALI